MARAPTITWTDRDGNTHEIDDKRKALIDEYLVNGYNVSKAYEKVYGKKDSGHASRTFWRPEVQEYLQYERQRIWDEKMVDKLRIMEKLYEMAMAPKDDPDYRPAIQTKALEMLGKYGGYIEDKKGDQNIRITLDK